MVVYKKNAVRTQAIVSSKCRVESLLENKLRLGVVEVGVGVNSTLMGLAFTRV